jgi:hypothetical protein
MCNTEKNNCDIETAAGFFVALKMFNGRSVIDLYHTEFSIALRAFERIGVHFRKFIFTLRSNVKLIMCNYILY